MPTHSSRDGVQAGDLVWVPVCADRYAVGIVLHISKPVRFGMVVGFLPRLFTSEQEVVAGTLTANFVETPKWTTTQMVSNGHWRVIGSDRALLDSVPPLTFRIGSSLYRNDEPVGKISPAEWAAYPELLGWGGIALQNHLRTLLCTQAVPS